MAHATFSLYQAEWCPHSAKIRQRLTELGVSFVAVPVPAERADREEMRRKTGTDEIPTVLFDDGTVLTGSDDEVIAGLDERFSERADADEHHRRAA
jgi:glutaredoxin